MGPRALPDGAAAIEWFSRSTPREFHGTWSARPRHAVKCIQDAFYWDIADRALIQGKLQRRVEKFPRGEYWREGWYVLVGSELWIFALPSNDSADLAITMPPSMLDMSLVDDASVNFVDSMSFSLAFQSDKEIFRAATVQDAKRWMLTLASFFHRRMSTISPNFQSHNMIAAQDYLDNDCMEMLESRISAGEREVSTQRLQAAEASYQFEGAMANALLRASFQDFLRRIREHSLLLFWSYAVDYRRSHPAASSAGYSRRDLIALDSISAALNRSIRSTFLDTVSSCSLALEPGDPRPHPDDLSPDAFLALEDCIWQRLQTRFVEFSFTSSFRCACQRLQQHRAAKIPSPPSSAAATAVVATAAVSCSPVPTRPKSLFSSFLLRSANTPAPQGPALPYVQDQALLQREELQTLRAQLSASKRAPAWMPDWWWASDSALALRGNFPSAAPTNDLPHWQAVSLESALDLMRRLLPTIEEGPVTHLPAPPPSSSEDAEQPSFLTELEWRRQQLHREQNTSLALLSCAPNQHVLGVGVVVLSSMMHVLCVPRPKPRGAPAVAPKARGDDPASSVRLESGVAQSRESEPIVFSRSDVDEPTEPAAVRSLVLSCVEHFSAAPARVMTIATVTFGAGYVYLLDPISSRPIACFRLAEILRIGPADKNILAFEMLDEEGASWQFAPEGLDEADAHNLRRRWLQNLWAMLRPPRTVFTIVKRGVLQKKGQLNTSFKPRFCELSSDLKLRYYKCDSGWTYKGQIDLILLDRFTLGKKEDVTRFEQLVCLSMQRTGRVWILKAASVAEAEEWVAAICDLLAVWGAKGQGARTLAGAEADNLETVSSDDDSDRD